MAAKKLKKRKIPPAYGKCAYCGYSKGMYNTWQNGEVTYACWNDFIKHRRKYGWELLKEQETNG